MVLASNVITLASNVITLARVNDGATGNGVSKTEVYYYLSTSNTSQSGGSWSTTVPDWIDGRYYWMKVKTTYTSGSTAESSPVCITGATGSTGTGVDTITTEFYLSTSKTSQTGGSWVTTMPTWSSGAYLWTRNKIVYKNPSSTVYTTPVCDSSWEAVNEVEIGGRNIIKNSGNFKSNYLWQYNGASSIDIVNEDGYPCLHALNGSIAQYSMIYQLEWDTVYIYHAVAKFSEEGTMDPTSPLHYWIYKTNDISKIEAGNGGCESVEILNTTYDIPANEWIHIVLKIKTIPKPSDYKYVVFRPFFYGGVIDSDIEYWIRWIKIEKGDKPTDWTPAPEDVEDGINDAQSTADQALSTAESNTTRVNNAVIDIDALKATISSLVTGQNGESLMTQTETGWTFSLANVLNTLNSATNNINSLNSSISATNNAVSTLNSTVNDLGRYTNYIKFGTDNGKPCIILGETDSAFKVIITNTDIRFMEGSSIPASISNQSLYIGKAVIREELRQGNFVWMARNNGNYGLLWKGE